MPYKHAAMPTVDPDPLCSNVYSVGERIVLLWLNHNYEQQRQNVWKNCNKGIFQVLSGEVGKGEVFYMCKG